MDYGLNAKYFVLNCHLYIKQEKTQDSCNFSVMKIILKEYHLLMIAV